jgi:probable HAF family extracellular repeat protein
VKSSAGKDAGATFHTCFCKRRREARDEPGQTLALLAGLVLAVLLAGYRQQERDALAPPVARPGLSVNAAGGAPGVRSGGPALAGIGGTLRDLGPLTDRVCPALGINGAGQVVGGWRADRGEDCALLASGDGDAEREALPAERVRLACAINRHGQIAGWAEGEGQARRAFLFVAGGYRDLGTLGGAESQALALNNGGEIVGRAALPDGAGRAFLFRRGVMHDIGTLGGDFSLACAINEAGDVAGWATATLGSVHAFLWRAGQMIDLGTLDGRWSLAHGLNDMGDVDGTAAVGEAGHAFLLRRAVMKDLGTLGGGGSTARDINNAGEVVGSAQTATGEEHAFVYRDGVMTDLNRRLPPGCGWVLTRAVAINDAGQIAGTGRLHGRQHGFLWTPNVRPASGSAWDRG